MLPPLLLEAARRALPTVDEDLRLFLLGAVGERDDGKLVFSKNGAARVSTPFYQYFCPPRSHAESRLVRKLGLNGIVYVARVAKENKDKIVLKMARPCDSCRVRLESAKVRKVYYSIDDSSYGVLTFSKSGSKDKIFSY